MVAAGGAGDGTGLKQDLSSAGLDEDQAGVYLRLLEIGSSKVRRLHKYFDHSRSTLYRILDELTEMGYATKSLARPTTYAPVEPEQVFELGFEEIDRSREHLSQVKDRRLAELERIAQVEPLPEDGIHWQRVEGTEAIYTSLHRLIDGAEEEVWTATNHDVSTAEVLPVVEESWRLALRRAREDGMTLRVLLDPEILAPSYSPEKLEAVEAIELRHLAVTETIHFVMADRSDLLMWVRPTPQGSQGPEDVAIRTDAPATVASHRMLYEHLWARTKPLDAASL